MVRPTHLRFIPDHVADQSLHRTDVPPGYLQRHRFDRFALEGTELPHHVPKELLPRLAPRKTIAEGFMKPPQFVQESFNIAWRQRKLRNRKHLAFGPISRSHNLPPVDGGGNPTADYASTLPVSSYMSL